MTVDTAVQLTALLILDESLCTNIRTNILVKYVFFHYAWRTNGDCRLNLDDRGYCDNYYHDHYWINSP